MKIPALSGLAVDVKRIADALTKLAEHAEVLAKKASEDLWNSDEEKKEG